MLQFRNITRFYTLFVCLLSANLISAQHSSDTIRLQSKLVPAISLIDKFEKLNNVRIYYEPEMFSDKNLDTSILNLSIDNFLQLLTKAGNCTLITVDSSSFVFVTSEPQTRTVIYDDAISFHVIGKMQEYGKYKKALITGRISDGTTGEPLPGVTFYVEKLNLGAVTDQSGNYSIEIPVGEYLVKLAFMGFEESYRRIKVVGSGKADFEIFGKSVNLHEVVITSERAEHNVTRTQMSILKFDAKSIKELPVTLGEADLIKSITLLPGIQSSGEFGTGFFVRGGTADQNLILIEDVPIFNSSHLFGLTSVVNPEGIASATLFKAGIPARYGERASSVMDIRLGLNNSNEVKVKGGIGLINSKISMDLPVGKKFVLSVGGRSSYSNWLLHKMPDLSLMNSSAGFYDMNGLLTYTLNTNNKVSLFGYRSNDNFSITNSMDYKYGNTLGSIKWHHRFSSILSSLLSTGFSKYDYYSSESDTNHRDKSYKINSSLFYKNLKYNFTWMPWQNHVFDLGINGIHYSVEPGKLNPYDSYSLLSPVTLQKEQALEYAIYASDNITFSTVFSAEIGLRYSGYAFLGPGSMLVYDPAKPRSRETITDTAYYSKGGIMKKYSGFEPRISLRYSIGENNSLKLSYNRINQYINLVSNTTVMNPADTWKLSNEYVKALVCGQYAVGYFQNFRNNMYETSVELYYKKLDHLIEYKDGASLILNPALEADLLDAKGYNYGAELYINKNKGRLTGWLSYAYSASRRRTSGLSTDQQVNVNNYYPSSYDQPHNLNMVGNYHISRRWRFSWTFSYRIGRPITLPELAYKIKDNTLIYYSDRNKYRLPDYHRLDIAITCDESLKIKKFWKGSWTFSIVNVYGRKNAYSVYYKKDTPSIANNFSNYSLYKLYVIGIPLPTLTYNFTF